MNAVFEDENEAVETDVEVEVVDVSAPEGEMREVDDNPLLAEFSEKFTGGNADEVILWLRDSQEITFPAAVRMFAELRKSTAPDASESKSAQVSTFIKSKYEEGYSRAQIIQLLQDKFDYSPKSAASVYSTAGRTLGILSGTGRSGGARVPMDQIVSTLRSCNQSKAAYVAALVDLGYSESTAAHFVNYIPMAKEWARQEAE